MWEGSLEKLKILNYERDYCKKLNRKFFNRVHFAVQGSNPIIQFDDFIGICTWLISDIKKKNDLFKKEEFDDPNIVVNKLIYALTKIDPEFRLPTPNQKLKAAYGEAVCTVLEFLTDKALGKRGFQWSNPIHVTNEEVIFLNKFFKNPLKVEFL
jgi:estrogen-related receptor beta like 1